MNACSVLQALGSWTTQKRLLSGSSRTVKSLPGPISPRVARRPDRHQTIYLDLFVVCVQVEMQPDFACLSVFRELAAKKGSVLFPADHEGPPSHSSQALEARSPAPPARMQASCRTRSSG